MRDLVNETSSLMRHDLDSLSIVSRIEATPARPQEVSALADMARRLIPGVQITGAILGEYLAFDPECLLAFRDQEKLLGGIAFLYLNMRGRDALLLNQITLTRPETCFLAGRDEEVSAIYVWAVVATRRGVAGFAKAAAHLQTPRYAYADCYSQPSTSGGRNPLIGMGFKPIPSLQRELWCYERRRKRSPEIAVNHPARSFADARQ